MKSTIMAVLNFFAYILALNLAWNWFVYPALQLPTWTFWQTFVYSFLIIPVTVPIYIKLSDKSKDMHKDNGALLEDTASFIVLLAYSGCLFLIKTFV